MKTLSNINEIEDGVYCCIIGEGDLLVEGWQCGGYACNHRTAYGKIFEVADREVAKKLINHFFSGKHCGWCDDGIDADDAQLVESLIPDFTVEARDYTLSCEAWVVGYYKGKRAVLFWENSD